MLRYAQILWDKVHWIFEADEFPDYPPDADGNTLIFIDITDRSEVQEGWDYDSDTGEFTPPPPEPQPKPQPEPEPYLDPSEETQMQTLLNTEYLLILAEINSGF